MATALAAIVQISQKTPIFNASAALGDSLANRTAASSEIGRNDSKAILATVADRMRKASKARRIVAQIERQAHSTRFLSRSAIANRAANGRTDTVYSITRKYAGPIHKGEVMSKAGLLTVLSTDGQPMTSLGMIAYDGSTQIKRNGEKKIMRFSSGKLGYFAGGKVVLDGKTYQVSCSFVELGNTVASPVKQFTEEQIAEMNAQAKANSDDDHEQHAE